MSRRRSKQWITWLPILFVAAMLYWTVALGLGGLSLMAAGALSGADIVAPAAPGDPIIVHLEESAEPEDDNDTVSPAAPAAVGSDDDGTGRMTGRAPVLIDR